MMTWYIHILTQTSSDIQWEVNLAIERAQNPIDLDQIAFNGLTFQDLHQADLVHH